VIDLHTHILPGLDDGPPDLAGSILIAREAVASGITALAATPHVRDDYPTTAEAMFEAVAMLRRALEDARVDIEILPGAEIAFDTLRRLDRDELRRFGLGGSPNHVLIELPLFGWPLDAEEQIRRLRAGGVTAVLAHPERNATAQASPGRLAALIRAGALVQVTAASLTGGFGDTAARTARAFIRSGLAHLVSSDTHRAGGRGTALGPALATIRDPLLVRWLTYEVPAAIVAGKPCPQRSRSSFRGRLGRGLERWVR
jgi:protein-tyrosine phosphatase